MVDPSARVELASDRRERIEEGGPVDRPRLIQAVRGDFGAIGVQLTDECVIVAICERGRRGAVPRTAGQRKDSLGEPEPAPDPPWPATVTPEEYPQRLEGIEVAMIGDSEGRFCPGR